MGAPILIKSTKKMSPLDIAKEEFDEEVLPIAVIRKMPDGSEIVMNMKGELIGKTGQ